jgi:hypothetical protein
MITLVLHLLRLLPFLCGGHRRFAIENFALRQQLAVYKRTVPRPRLRTTDRRFWVGLARVWTGWRQALVVVSPTTVLRWRRRRFRAYWTRLSGRPTGGRPPVNAEIKAPVTRMAAANPLWGAPRIHGELLKLGLDVAERTVSRLLTKRRTPPSQSWRTFLANHVRDLVSLDFFTVPPPGSASSSSSSCSLTIAAGHPLQRDRASHLAVDGPADQCLDHVLVLGERHLRRTLTRYFAYYHEARTHLSLDKDAPNGRPTERDQVLAKDRTNGVRCER